MYKQASQTQQYLERNGSKSMRPTKTGDNADIATQRIDVGYTLDTASERLREAALIDKEIEAVKIELSIKREQKAEITVRLSATLPFQEFTSLKAASKSLGLEQQKLQKKLIALKAKRRGLHVSYPNSFERAFVEMAEQSLPPDVFQSILNETKLKFFKEQPND